MAYYGSKENVSTKQKKTPECSWLPGKDEDRRRPQGDRKTSRQRQKGVIRLKSRRWLLILNMKRADRIRKNEEFSRIISKHHSLAGDSFVVYFDHRNEDHARAGISVSKKLGNAVERNRIKRQVREMIRSIVDFDSCPIDLIVIVRKDYLLKAFKENKNNLENIIKKAIIKQYE